MALVGKTWEVYMRFKDVKVAYKILVLVVIAGIAMAMIGYTGYSSLQSAGADLDNMYTRKLTAVRLLGDRASVSVNDTPAIDLPSMGSEGTTFSNGQRTLTIVQGRLSWGVGRAVPTACTGG